VTNSGGLRVSLAPGPITAGDVFELMPFENFVVVLTMTGVQVDSLAQQLARINGEPIAGWSFQINQDEEAVNIQVRGEPLDPARTYRVATINYLVDGGGGMPSLWTPRDRTDTTLLFRDAIAAYVRRQAEAGEPIAPVVEGRITRIATND
jgi:2',3'-cyclic-nucleotide 2'-phosphodiesterase (5'-nucleotidase family)